MSEERDNLQFQLGQMTAQLTSLGLAFTEMAKTIVKLEERLRLNETNTTVLMVKMALISMVAGGAGSFLFTILLNNK